MGNVINFVAGGAALGGNLRNALDETLQNVVAHGTKQTLVSAFFSNTGASAATVKLFWSSPRWDLTFGGTIVDGDYVVEFRRPDGRLIETATVNRDADVPADEAALAVAMETEIESYVATTLASFVVSADDDTVDGNIILGVRNTDIRLVTSAPGTATLVAAEVGPVLSTGVADMVITVPAGSSVAVYLGEKVVPRLWMAATAESGAGATAPNADITGFLVLG